MSPNTAAEKLATVEETDIDRIATDLMSDTDVAQLPPETTTRPDVATKRFYFGTHPIHQHQQKYEAYIPPASKRNDSRPFLIWIHGGAWRDPQILARNSFASFLIRLFEDPAPASPGGSTALSEYFSGFISLNYRLSAHPDKPQGKEIPEQWIHDAKHPDHIADILMGLQAVYAKYGFSEYILIGHSVGATMAFQTLMDRELILGRPRPRPSPGDDPKKEEGEEKEEKADNAVKPAEEKWDEDGNPIKKWDLFKPLPQPIAIVGIAGIYDLPLFYAAEPSFAGFIPGALGPDRDLWRALSPACWSGWETLWASSSSSDPTGQNPKTKSERKSERESEHDRPGPVIVLAQSAEDDDVEYEQVEKMINVLQKARTNVEFLEIHGNHDLCWQTGHGVVRAVQHAVGVLEKRKRKMEREREVGEG